MNQLAIDFTKPERREPVHPKSTQKQLWALLEALRRGERLTVLLALEKYGCYALSQRIGQLKGLGWPVMSQMIETSTGKHVMEYWLVSAHYQ